MGVFVITTHLKCWFTVFQCQWKQSSQWNSTISSKPIMCAHFSITQQTGYVCLCMFVCFYSLSIVKGLPKKKKLATEESEVVLFQHVFISSFQDRVCFPNDNVEKKEKHALQNPFQGSARSWIMVWSVEREKTLSCVRWWTHRGLKWTGRRKWNLSHWTQPEIPSI